MASCHKKTELSSGSPSLIQQVMILPGKLSMLATTLIVETSRLFGVPLKSI